MGGALGLAPHRSQRDAVVIVDECGRDGFAGKVARPGNANRILEGGARLLPISIDEPLERLEDPGRERSRRDPVREARLAELRRDLPESVQVTEDEGAFGDRPEGVDFVAGDRDLADF